MTTVQPATQRARQLLDGVTRVAQRTRLRPPAPAPAPAPNTLPRLAPTTALRENGFAVFRGLFPVEECRRLAVGLKAEAGIHAGVKYTKVDATNAFPTAREIMLEGRILDAVRSSLGHEPKFLQVSDLHYLHDTAGWHRDSVHRKHDASEAPDWSDTERPFGVVKAILYLETDNAAMGIMAGSHRSPLEMDHEFVRSVEQAGGQRVVGAADDPNLRRADADRRIPLAWSAQVGDVLVFDERMYHAGRRVDAGRVSSEREAPKFTLSLVFGKDNHHSQRMYSYFRYARKELCYRDLAPDFALELQARGLVLSSGWTNFYLDEPQELRHVHLPDPSRLEPLIAEFSQR